MALLRLGIVKAGENKRGSRTDNAFRSRGKTSFKQGRVEKAIRDNDVSKRYLLVLPTER